MTKNNEIQDNATEEVLKKNNYIEVLFSKYSFWKILKSTVFVMIVMGYLDIKNIPSQFCNNNVAHKMLLILGVLLLFALFMEKHVSEIRKISAIYDYDYFLCILNGFAVFYLLLVLLVQIAALYKIITLVSILALTIGLICYRKYKYEKMVKNANGYCPNTVDLKDLYEGNISNAKEMVFLDEHEVDYDLLNRKPVIDFLYYTLCQCKPKGQFVISLEGKWGVGKTTILKNVKRRIQQEQKDIVIIDDFDPWIYGTEEALIENFFAILLKSNLLRINAPELKKSILTLTRAIISSKEKNTLLEEVFRKDNSVYESKKLIEEYLKLCGKRIVIFIDNLDRIEDEKVIFLFKLLANALNFDRVIFVISFDVEKVKAIFDKKLNIDYSYLEKIVQMQIKVPEVDGNIISGIIQTCTENIIKHHNEEAERLHEYIEFAKNIADNITDIRSYKRIVNSVISKTLYNNSN